MTGVAAAVATKAGAAPGIGNAAVANAGEAAAVIPSARATTRGPDPKRDGLVRALKRRGADHVITRGVAVKENAEVAAAVERAGLRHANGRLRLLRDGRRSRGAERLLSTGRGRRLKT